MAETVTYVNRSNLATFLKKIKELIPSSLTFLTKTEAEETYQEKLEGYTEKINYHSGTLDITIDAKDSDEDMGLLTLGAGSLVIETRGATTSSGVRVNLNGGGQFSVTGGQGFTYNGSRVLTASDVVDDLTSESEETPLSANQGRVLNEKISDILPKSDVMTDTNVAMLSRMFALPLKSSVGAGLYQPSINTIGVYREMFDSMNDGELVVCEYEGVKGLYIYRGGSQLYCFTQYIADLGNMPTGVENSLTSSSKTTALSANQGRVLDEGKQDKLQYYTEDSSPYPSAQVDCGAYSGNGGAGLTLHTNPTSSSSNYAQIDLVDDAGEDHYLRLDKDGVFHNGKSLGEVNHIWMCAGKNSPADRANLVPADGTPSVGDCILWMTLDANLCASTIQPLHITSVSSDGQTLVYVPYTSWI